MAVTEGHKTCCRCKRTKPKFAFNNHKRSKDGKSSWCKDCERLYKLHKKLEPKEPVERKRCIDCKEVFPKERFTRDMDRRDGLSSRCKGCQAIKWQAMKKREVNIPEEKRCSRCGLVKSYRDYDKRGDSKDGLRGVCKACHRLSLRLLYITRRAQKGIKGVKGISNWQQVECCIREMSELQSLINDEKTKSEKYIRQAKERLAETITPLLKRQSNMQIMIEDFIRTTLKTARKLVKKFRFGTLTFYRGKMDVFLEPELARGSIGKP